MATFLVIAAVVVALPGAIAAVHLTVLGAASLLYREPRLARVPPTRFLVLVPAHDEELVLGPTLEAITAALRPGDQLVVVADRCQDRTAEIARAHGADVVERRPGEEPGRAAARQAGIEHALTLPWDAIVMIDADSVVEAGFLDACEQAFATGASALQARSEAAVGPRLIDQVWLASFALQGVLIPRGRDRLGLLVRLRGTGMALRRDVVEAQRFRAPAGEDRWYGLDLALSGSLPRHVDSARLRSANAPTWKVAADQRLRYEAGRLSGAREFTSRLLQRRTAATLEAAVDLLTPPFAIAVLSLVTGLGLALAAGSTVVGAGIALLGLALTAVLVLALLQAAVGPRTWAALAAAPWYLVWKAAIQFRALVSVGRRETYYPPTPRA